MYQQHKAFESLPGNSKIWRYLDFTKYVDMLEKQALYFCRSDLLGDPFEGSTPLPNRTHRQGEGKRLGVSLDHLGKHHERFRQLTYVNCWSVNEHESAGMWKLFLKTNEGIAIQSTVEKFQGALDPADQEPIFIGSVKYIDYEKQGFADGNFLAPFVHKRKSFEHEREMRAVMVSTDLDPGCPGLLKKISLPKLIGCIYVAPSAPTWFRPLVAAITKKYELSVPVVQSDLDKAALF